MNHKKWDMKVFCLAVFMPSLLHAHGEDSAVHAHHEPTLSEKALDIIVGRAEAAASIHIQGDRRIITGNGYPDHQPGAFPNRGNPHSISKKSYKVSLPLEPTPLNSPKMLGWGDVFGISVDGVLFEGLTAEYWQNDRSSTWNYYAYHDGCNLGLDHQNAHVQPDGTYHYHGVPTGLMKAAMDKSAPTLIGYAADGYPIYGPMGYVSSDDETSGVKSLSSSYRLKSGKRPDGPGGRYSGAFMQDYAYVEGHGDLDQCNGRVGVTPDYPDGTYHYVITEDFPNIPICWMGQPGKGLVKKRKAGMRMAHAEGQGDRSGKKKGHPPRHEKGKRHGDHKGGPRKKGGRGGPCSGY